MDVTFPYTFHWQYLDTSRVLQRRCNNWLEYFTSKKKNLTVTGQSRLVNLKESGNELFQSANSDILLEDTRKIKKKNIHIYI